MTQQKRGYVGDPHRGAELPPDDPFWIQQEREMADEQISDEERLLARLRGHHGLSLQEMDAIADALTQARADERVLSDAVDHANERNEELLAELTQARAERNVFREAWKRMREMPSAVPVEVADLRMALTQARERIAELEKQVADLEIANGMMRLHPTASEQRLREALGDAIEGMDEMLRYIDPYFVLKWGLKDYPARARAALTPEEPKGDSE